MSSELRISYPEVQALPETRSGRRYGNLSQLLAEKSHGTFPEDLEGQCIIVIVPQVLRIEYLALLNQ